MCNAVSQTDKLWYILLIIGELIALLLTKTHVDTGYRAIFSLHSKLPSRDVKNLP